MKKLTAMLAMLLSVSILLCACGSKADGGDTADDSNSGEGDKILVGMVTDMAIDQARQVFSEEEIVEIVSCVAMVGWFNRWNGLMGSELEPMPSEALAHVPWLQDLEV